MVVELMPHQVEAVEKMANGKILWGGVGTGKSIAAVAYYEKNEAPKDVYVITTAKKRDDVSWEGEFAKYGVGKHWSATLAGVLTIDSWNNIGKYASVEGAFFIFDEQRLVGAGQWAKVFLKISKKNNWILLSATPGDTWLDYIPVFLANGFYANRTEFKREHVVYNTYSKFPKVDRYVSVGKLVRLRNSLLVEMPYMRRTVRHQETIAVDWDTSSVEKVTNHRWNVFEGRPLRDVAELFSTVRKVVNSDASRLDAVKTLTGVHDRLIVFYNFNYELDRLRTLADEITISEWNGHKHEAIPDTDRWVYLVQYMAGAEAWECISTNAMVFYSQNYSYKIMEQAKGRIDRLNTLYKHLYYYTLMSRAWIDVAIAKSLGKKESFNETKLKENLRKI